MLKVNAEGLVHGMHATTESMEPARMPDMQTSDMQT
jgi:hypothetical protein